MTKILAAIGVLIIANAPAFASPPCYSYQTYHYQKPAAQAILVVPTVYVPFSSYTIGYNFKAEKQTEDNSSAILQKLEAIEKRIQTLESSPPKESLRKAQELIDTSVTSCASCHSGPKAKGGFSIDNVNESKAQKAIEEISSGRMPPETKLTFAQKRKAISAFLGEPK